MSDEEAARRYCAAVAQMLEVSPLQEPTRSKAKRFLMIALDLLA